MKTRPAQAGDAPAIARLIYLAGLGHLDVSLYDPMFPGPPGPTRDRLSMVERLLTVKTVSWFHHSLYYVVEADGRTAATLCAYSKEEGRARHLVAALFEAGWREADILAMGERMEPVTRVQPRAPAEAWVIENVAAFPGFRRRGFVNALLELALEEGGSRGHTHFQIGCVIGNGPALAAYEKAGFRITEERTDPEFERVFGSPGMWRLTLRTADS